MAKLADICPHVAELNIDDKHVKRYCNIPNNYLCEEWKDYYCPFVVWRLV